MSDIVNILHRECDHQMTFGNDMSDVLLPAATEIERLRARVAQLEAAIKPLASLPLWPEELAAVGDRDLTIGEIRAARAALKDTTL